MSIASCSNGASASQQAASPARAQVTLPREALVSRPILPAPASWGGFPTASTPLVTPVNAATTAWRTAVCPFAPVGRRPHAPNSLEPTPTSSVTSSAGLTPTNIWPERMQPALWPVSAPQVYPGGPSCQPPFSADVTPISASTCSNKRVPLGELDWLRNIIEAPMTGSGTPSNSSLPSRKQSTMSLDPLNTAQLMDAITPTSSMAGDSVKGDDGQAFFFSRPSLPDNGPAANFRNLGA